MSQGNLRVLQLNMMKLRAGMEALINDPQTQDLDILLIQEPPLSAYRTHVNHRLWYRYQPTFDNDNDIRRRSVIYVNKRISTSGHRQISMQPPRRSSDQDLDGMQSDTHLLHLHATGRLSPLIRGAEHTINPRLD